MSQVPEEFQERLNREFRGRLRLRWSDQKQEYHLEQKVSRALASFPTHESDDESIRLRDGYLYLLSIRAGTRMPCPRCQLELQVPVREIREISCQFCKLSGREHRVVAGYFPLDDRLVDYLKRLDPERDASWEVRNAVEAHNQHLMEQQRQQVLNSSLDKMNDDFSRIAGIPSVGYTGKETYGDLS